jgi:hypothetical protein
MKLPTCNYRHANGDGNVFRCTHPLVVAIDGNVITEVCRICTARNSAERPRPLVAPPPPRIQPGQRPRTVAVVIPCHNYGRYLAEAIQSALDQTRPADEIVVVDDASDDSTEAVARAFAGQGVKYLRVEERHSQRTRRAGWLATASEALCFLDADDTLSRDYLARGLDEFNDVRVGMVYSDVEFFGQKLGGSDYPEAFDRGRLARMNFLHTGCLVRREALDISRALEVVNDDSVSLQDWLLWRRVADYGWLARKQKALYRYRRHASSMTADWHDEPYDYFARASLALETVTLFVPLSGRTRLWPAMAAFLERQTWPHDQTRLVLFDTSQDAGFSKQVRHWMAGCDYRDARHWREAVGEPGLAELPRGDAAHEVTLAMTRIYNRLAREAITDYVWVVEDDVLPPLDACRRLLRDFDPQTASVSGVYRSRFGEEYVVWRRADEIASGGSGVEQVAGNGFGCVVLRGDVLRETVFTASIDLPAYDTAFYYRLPSTCLTAKVDWSVECDHRMPEAASDLPQRKKSEREKAESKRQKAENAQAPLIPHS